MSTNSGTHSGAEADVLLSCRFAEERSARQSSLLPADTASARWTIADRRAAARRRSPTALLRKLRRLVSAHEDRHQAVATQIHEDVAQPLVAALMQLEALRHNLEDRRSRSTGCSADPGPLWAASLNLVRRSLAEARRLINSLRPPILREMGIAAAVEHLIHELRSEEGPRIEFEPPLTPQRFPPLLESVAYRIAEESLNNALRHSGSPVIHVGVQHAERWLEVQVEDWGRGFDLRIARRQGRGLRALHAYGTLLGGLTRIDTAPGYGTRIAVALPVRDPGLGGMKATQ